MSTRYRRDGNNGLLRHFLSAAWGGRCYWCGNPNSNLQIDHIIPQNLDESRFTEVKETLGLPDEFDVHALYNLAPACPSCNTTKSNSVFIEKPIVLTQLKRAQKLAPRITEKVDNFRKRSDLSAAILTIIESEVDDEEARRTLLQDGPEIVQKIAMLDPAKADHIEIMQQEIDLAGCCHNVLMHLNERGRSAKLVLEEVAGGNLREALKDPMSDILSRTNILTKATIQSNESRGGPEFNLVEVNGSEFVVDRFDLQRTTPPTNFYFEASGEFVVDSIGIVARTSIIDGDLESVQADVTVSGSFSFGIHWSLDSITNRIKYSPTQIWREQVNYLIEGGSYYQYGHG